MQRHDVFLLRADNLCKPRAGWGRPHRPPMDWLPLASLMLVMTACGRLAAGPPPARYIDLVQELPRAEKRSAQPPDRAIAVKDVEIGGRVKRSIATNPSARIIWTVWIPRNATLGTELGIDPRVIDAPSGAVLFRIGISDDRFYEELFRQELRVGRASVGRRWIPIEIPFHRYAGWQWSLFYHPSSHPWRVIFNTSATGIGVQTEPWALWGAPNLSRRR